MSSVSFKSRSPDLRRRFLAIATVVLALIVIGVGATFFAINRAIESGSAPVHRFPVSAGESFLTDDRAAAIAREVMNRDGFPESAWRLMNDDRTKAPDGRPDQFLMRNTINLDQGCVSFGAAAPPLCPATIPGRPRDGKRIPDAGTVNRSRRPFSLNGRGAPMDDEYTSIIKQFLGGPHAEALGWLRVGSGNGRTLGEHRRTEQSVALVKRLYALGAEKVIAVGLPEAAGGRGRGAARYLLVELPEEDRGRDALFAFEREHAEARGFEGTPDEGRLYLFLDVKGVD
jgi:hypothetical protein